MLNALSSGKSVGREIKFISAVVLKTTTSHMLDAFLTLLSLRTFEVGFEQDNFGTWRMEIRSLMGQPKHAQVSRSKEKSGSRGIWKPIYWCTQKSKHLHPFVAAKLLSS